MGKFFNQIISKMPIIPTGKTTRKNSLEELRIKFNEGQVEDTLKEKRIANLVKAREAKKKKANV